MDIQTMHFVSLEHSNDIMDEDRSFIRTEHGTWFETNGHLGDRHDRVDDETLTLKLEAKFWETMYELK